MPCTLRVRDDLTIHDIRRLARMHYLEVTPHVGNWTPARLVLPTLGVSVLCVDHTIGIKDRNAHPHLLIQGGVAHEICQHSDRLTTHACVTRETPVGEHPLGTSLSEVHVGALRQLYPLADIMTHVEYLHTHQELILAVLEETTALSVTATWWRKVDVSGVVTNYGRKQLPRAWNDFAEHIFPLTNRREGWLIHNRINILMDMIVQSRMGAEPEIYHLSGPDMVRYLGAEIAILSRMYDRVRTRLGLRQESITINLVPFASFRFATRMSQAAACERMCEELEAKNPSSAVLRACAREAPDVFAESETQSYFSQHDSVATGEQVVVPEVAKSWSMATCAKHLSLVRSVA